jgi:hypothetical protein
MKPSRIARIPIVALPIVAIAGCSSSSSAKSDAKNAKDTASAKTSSSSSSTSSTTAGSTSASAPCTVAAASAALAPDTASSIACGGGWAAGAASNTQYDYAYLLHDVNGTWTSIDNDQSQGEMQQACATGNPLAIPESVLAVSPCRVS